MHDVANQFLVGTVSLVAYGLLMFSGARDIGGRSLRYALMTQRVLPQDTARVLGIAVPKVEFIVGGVGLAATLGPGTGQVPLLLLCCTTLYATFAVYSWVALVKGVPGAPCGCGHSRASLTWTTVGRAGVLAMSALVSVAGGATPLQAGWTVSFVLEVLASVGLGVALWVLPESLDPDGHVGVESQ